MLANNANVAKRSLAHIIWFHVKFDQRLIRIWSRLQQEWVYSAECYDAVLSRTKWRLCCLVFTQRRHPGVFYD